MASSTVPAAKAALLAIIDADATLGPVAHGWGPPPPDQFQQEHIWFGDTNVAENIVGSGGGSAGTPKHEDYDLTLTFHVRKGGYDEQATETRAWTLVAALEALIRQNPTLGASWSSHFLATVSGKRSRGFPVQDNAGWASEIDVLITCSTHI